MKFDFKNGKTYFESLISPSFDELHCSTIVHMNHMKHMFQDLPFYCTKKVPKNHNQFFHLRQGGGTHFLVLAHTLIYMDRPRVGDVRLVDWYTGRPTRRALKTRSFSTYWCFYLPISLFKFQCTVAVSWLSVVVHFKMVLRCAEFLLKGLGQLY